MLLIFVLLATFLAFIFVWQQFRYWTRRGIPQLNPSVPFGNFGDFLCQKQGIPQTYADLYEQTSHLPFVGIYLSLQPVLLVNDPDLLKDIMTRDFEHFHDRGLHVDEKMDPMSGHLIGLGGKKWKNLRTKLTPAFSSGSLKEFFPLMFEKAMNLQQKFRMEIISSEVVEVKELAARYTCDVIASVAYGIDMDSINHPDDLFRRMGEKVIAQDLITSLRLALVFWFPRLKAALRCTTTSPEVREFMTELVHKTIEHREQEGIQRKDLMQLLIEMRNSGSTGNSSKGFSIDEITAQVMIFFIAGYETSSTTISFCLFELARHRDIQTKVHQEIDAMLSKEETMTYSSVTSLKYLQQCLDETVRKYPPAAFLSRGCTKSYRIPGTEAKIEKGTAVVASLMGLHRDPRYFPQPNEFRPERFGDGEQNKAYFGFGAGPRLCIGMRFGQLQAKVALAALLSKFEFRLANQEEQHGELKLAAKSFVLTTENGIQLIVRERKLDKAN